MLILLLLNSALLSVFCAALLVFLATFANVFIVQADDLNPGVFSKDSSPYGIPYKEWITKWWQWIMSIPKEQHPRLNYTPERCGIEQTGPVWFLADKGESGTEVRTCTIPAGKAILFAVLLRQRLTELNHPDHMLRIFPNLGHLFYPSSQWTTAMGPIQQYVLVDLYAWLEAHYGLSK